MAKLSYFGTLVAVAISAAWCQQTTIRSPEVTSGGMVTFRLNAPKAMEVTLTGEFMKEAKTLQKDDRGVWSLTVGPIPPEIYSYNYTIDGVRTIDPHNPSVKTGSTPSTIASLLEVRGPATVFYDGQPVAHGEIRTDWYHSQSLRSLRRVTVYTPPGYDGDMKTLYPVLYLFHGANADERAWTQLGRVNLILDNLIAAHKAKRFIVVMPFGYGVDPGAPGNDAAFSRDLIEDVIPFIQSKYRVSTDRTQRAVAGLSMGGGQSLSIGLNHLDLFSYVAGFSAAVRPAEFARTFAGAVSRPDVNEKLKLLWVGCGSDDSLMTNNRAFADFLNERKVKHTFRVSEGAHTWMVWRRYLNEVAPLLFKVE